MSLRARQTVVAVTVILMAAALTGCKQDPPRTVGDVASNRFRTYNLPIRSDRKHPTLAQKTKGANGSVIPVELSRLDPTMTHPIDLPRDGTYELRAGPIDINQFDPDVFGIQPPTDVADSVRLVSPLVLEGDEVVFSVAVSGLHKPYPGFQVWVY